MEFARRHIGPSPDEQRQMLSAVGYSALDELTEAALPASVPGRHPPRRSACPRP